ncbi:DUF2232 domain-containing protein [Gemella sp. 19428wG2_WT2a]|nr:DUF2232 domain-containing protein [Gemella sp. 19428wG2_WT2a]
MKERKIDFKKELDFILSTEIFFKSPSNGKVLLFSLLYVALTIIGAYLEIYIITSIITLPLLVYVLAARGNSYFIPLAILTIFNTYLVSSLDATVWNIIHVLLALIIYHFIKYRRSKLFILMTISAVIFFGITLYMHILILTSTVNYSPEAIQVYIDSYIAKMSSIEPTTDVDLFREVFEQIKRYLPTLVFMIIVAYSVLLINYTFFILSREKAIVPIFQKFKLVAIGKDLAYLYILITLIVLVIAMSGVDLYDPYYLFFDNLYSIFRWIFVFNGVCTIFFFIEEKTESSSGFLKVLTLVSAYLFSSLFDVIGLVDSLMKLRERYLYMKGEDS